MTLDHLFFEDIRGASSRALLRGMWGGAALAEIPPSVTESALWISTQPTRKPGRNPTLCPLPSHPHLL